MAETAFQTQYRQEFIAGFEEKQSLLRDTVTTEAVIKGNVAVFLVADSGSATAVTRGANGLIPARADNLTQNSCTLGEWHDLVRKTGFNIFASQGNQRAIMQDTTMGVINRKTDSQILDVLATGTVSFTVTVPTVANAFQRARVKLGNAKVPWDSQITLVCTASFLAYMELAPEFAKADYVNVKPYAGSDENPSWRDRPMAYRWRNVLIVEHPACPGVGTSAEQSYMYHKTAVGHAANVEGLDSEVGYNGEQKYTWARCSMDMGAVLMQNPGVIVINHDGSALA